MRLIMEDMDKIEFADHSDSEETSTIEKDGRKYHIGINKKFKEDVVIEEFDIV